MGQRLKWTCYYTKILLNLQKDSQELLVKTNRMIQSKKSPSGKLLKGVSYTNVYRKYANIIYMSTQSGKHLQILMTLGWNL